MYMMDHDWNWIVCEIWIGCGTNGDRFGGFHLPIPDNQQPTLRVSRDEAHRYEGLMIWKQYTQIRPIPLLTLWNFEGLTQAQF